jgi:hypothetical protein
MTTPVVALERAAFCDDGVDFSLHELGFELNLD